VNLKIIQDDGGMAEVDEASGAPAAVWVAWRQDDNGNRYEVARRESRAAAEELAAEFEARGYKALLTLPWVYLGDQL
jgi:hypothetical protein